MYNKPHPYTLKKLGIVDDELSHAVKAVGKKISETKSASGLKKKRAYDGPTVLGYVDTISNKERAKELIRKYEKRCIGIITSPDSDSIKLLCDDGNTYNYDMKTKTVTFAYKGNTIRS